MIALQKKAASAKDFTKDVITDKDNDKVDDNNKGISYSTKDLIETDKDFLDDATRKTVKAMKNGAVSGLIETKAVSYTHLISYECETGTGFLCRNSGFDYCTCVCYEDCISAV